jgi:hypothetical protein
MARPRCFVVHWHPDELPKKARVVEEAGGDVVGSESKDGRRAAQRIKDLEPDALLVWLSRLPSHGRVTAAFVRSQVWGRKMPILLVDGDPEALPDDALAKVKSAVPDALFLKPAQLRLWLGKIAERKAEQAAESSR